MLMNQSTFSPPEKLLPGKQRNSLAQITFNHLSALLRIYLEIIETGFKTQSCPNFHICWQIIIIFYYFLPLRHAIALIPA